jgi:MFS family permease
MVELIAKVCGLLADGYGRRVCIFVGCLLVWVGTAVQASANHIGQFIGGRFILGFGASIASAAGPAYTVELAHPAYRGTMAGMYNNFWWYVASHISPIPFLDDAHAKNTGSETSSLDGLHTARISTTLPVGLGESRPLCRPFFPVLSCS